MASGFFVHNLNMHFGPPARLAGRRGAWFRPVPIRHVQLSQKGRESNVDTCLHPWRPWHLGGSILPYPHSLRFNVFAPCRLCVRSSRCVVVSLCRCVVVLKTCSPSAQTQKPLLRSRSQQGLEGKGSRQLLASCANAKPLLQPGSQQRLWGKQSLAA
jgi:hypothetical protein